MDRQLDNLIRFHEGVIRDAQAWGEVSVRALEELTVRYLKELKELKNA